MPNDSVHHDPLLVPLDHGELNNLAELDVAIVHHGMNVLANDLARLIDAEGRLVACATPEKASLIARCINTYRTVNRDPWPHGETVVEADPGPVRQDFKPPSSDWASATAVVTTDSTGSDQQPKDLPRETAE